MYKFLVNPCRNFTVCFWNGIEKCNCFDISSTMCLRDSFLKEASMLSHESST